MFYVFLLPWDLSPCLLQNCLFTPPHSVIDKNGADHSFNVTRWLWWMHRFSTCAFFFLWLRFKQEVDMLKSTCCHSKYHPIHWPVPAAFLTSLCFASFSRIFCYVSSLCLVWSVRRLHSLKYVLTASLASAEPKTQELYWAGNASEVIHSHARTQFARVNICTGGSGSVALQ